MYVFKQSCGNCGNDSFEIFLTEEDPTIVTCCGKCGSKTTIKYQSRLEISFSHESEGILYRKEDAEKIII
jgi:rRNA maturation protein Nop10